MSYCQECGRPLSQGNENCPGCASHEDHVECDVPGEAESAPNVRDANVVRQVAIARFQSGAEAGFFADELCREIGVAVGPEEHHVGQLV